MKKIYYTYGLPRSGNTLMASLLNQNPNITATPLTITPQFYYSIIESLNQDIFYENVNCDQEITNVLNNIHLNYYKDYKSDYIIERSGWITPYNLDVLKKYSVNEIKIVIVVRDVLEVLNSFIKLCLRYPNFFINELYNNSINPKTSYKTEIEEKCDMLMQRDSQIDTALYGIKYLLDYDHPEVEYMFVEYNDLVNNTQETINRIYNFYDIEEYHNHKFTNLDLLNGYKYNSPMNIHLHIIKQEKIEKNNEWVLPESVMKKYSGLEFWRK